MFSRSLALVLVLSLSSAAFAAPRAHKPIRAEDRQMYADRYRAPLDAGAPPSWRAQPAPVDSRIDPLSSANGQ